MPISRGLPKYVEVVRLDDQATLAARAALVAFKSIQVVRMIPAIRHSPEVLKTAPFPHNASIQVNYQVGILAEYGLGRDNPDTESQYQFVVNLKFRMLPAMRADESP